MCEVTMSLIRAVDSDDQVPDSNVSILPQANLGKATTQPRPGAEVEVSGYDPDDTDIIDLPGSLVGRLPLRYLDV